MRKLEGEQSNNTTFDGIDSATTTNNHSRTVSSRDISLRTDKGDLKTIHEENAKD